MGVCIFFGGATVGSPAGVADAEGAVDRGGLHDGFEVLELAGGAAELEAGGTTGYGDSGGDIAAVLETAKTFDDGGDN